ncbi:MAG: hypothetical protein J6Y25_04070 [Elusimicrobiaceae bacterium]|nr:hypothetical protein [Elusimicrobiaceae bacterium]
MLRTLQSSFIGGEISPSLQAHTDTAAYHTWLRTAKNMWVHPQGGISNRPGTQYMGSAKSTGEGAQLFPFVVSSTEMYVIEAGEKYFRLYTDNGPVQDGNGNVLELQTPYPAQALETLRTAAYHRTLYLAHADYPLMQLVCTAPGQFSLGQVPLKGGPFQPQNTDETKQMRLYPQTTTVTSEGVAAHVSFQPVNYTDCMVWAYFNGEWFYASEDFGLNAAALVQAFNTAYGSQGFTAQNLGGIIQITSPAATGGNWNGKTIVLEYHRGFSSTPVHTLTQTLSGGENDGTQTVAQEGRYILESNGNYFVPQHVDTLFCVIHTVDAQYQSGSLGYEAVSAAISSGSDWTLRTSGTWTGTVSVEVSKDLGQTWQTVKTLSRASGDSNFYLSGNLNDAENLFKVRVRSGQITGEIGYELSADSFVQRAIVKAISYVSATQLVVSCERAFGSSAWSAQWAEGSFGPASGYPACVFCFQDRLGLAATRQEPQTLWFSKTGNWTDFGRARDTLLDTDALSIRLSGGQLNAVQAVCVANRLLIFTTGGEWSLSCNGSFTLDHIQLEAQGSRGASAVAPVMAGGRILFVQTGGKVVRDFYYDDTASAYASDDLTLRARHLFEETSITQMAFVQGGDSLLWCACQDGKFLSLTYLPEQGIYAWTQHQTQGLVRSICVLPQPGQEEVWLLVQRGTQYFVERMFPRVLSTQADKSVFLDAAVVHTFQTAQTAVAGLTHLNGQTVCAVADGNVVPNLTVSNGQITLPFAAQEVQVGLGYIAQLCTLPVIQQGRPHRIVEVKLWLLNSRGGQVGLCAGASTPLVQRTQEAYNTPVSLQTGQVTVPLAGRTDVTSGVMLEQHDPLPLTVLRLDVKAA